MSEDRIVEQEMYDRAMQAARVGLADARKRVAYWEEQVRGYEEMISRNKRAAYEMGLDPK